MERETSLPRFPWRLFVYMVVVLYLAVDLYLLEGPIWKMLHERSRSAHAAQVNGEPISWEALRHREECYLWQRGLEAEALTLASRQTVRWLALQELIDEALWRQALAVEKEDVESFGHGEEGGFEELMPRFQEEELTSPEVGDEFLATLEMPLVVRARHLFWPHSGEESETPPAEVAEVESLLEQGESWEGLAARYSRDGRTKGKAGELGFFTLERVPSSLRDILAALEPGEGPRLIRSDWGWHWVEVLEKRNAHTLASEEIAPWKNFYRDYIQREHAREAYFVKLRAGAEIEYGAE